MRQLILVPIIHMSADLGTIAQDVNKKGIAGFGEEFWKGHKETVSGFWDSIAQYFTGLEVKGYKIYQDGMVGEGEVGEKIVEEAAKSGSKNHEIVSSLLKRGAVLVKTEDFVLVKEEHDRLLAITKARSTIKKLNAFARYKLMKNRLLNKRDDYIAKRIDETLRDEERGIIFIGAFHNIKKRLPESIQILEIKETEKIREYQKLLLFYKRNKERFKELGTYLTSNIEV